MFELSAMGDEFPSIGPLVDRRSEDEDEDAVERNEKSRIAEVAAATLCRLNSIMKQMKDWREDRAKLSSNVWRLKLALRVAGREAEDTLYADPLIDHQREKIRRLEAANQALKKELMDVKTALIDADRLEACDDAWSSDDKLLEAKQEFLVEKERLNNEILYLRSQLRETEEGHEHSSELEHLRCKLKHFVMVDHTMEIIFTDIVNKVAETIANMSEELVNASEHLRRSRTKNDDLHLEIDELKALLRHSCGDSADYKQRTHELNSLTKRLKTELRTFKVSLEGKSWSSESSRSGNLVNAERLANDLMVKLRNDHEALLAAGNPDRLQYMRRITELRVSLKHLRVELRRSSVHSSLSKEASKPDESSRRTSTLESTLRQIAAEIDRSRSERATKHCRAVGVEGLEYLRRLEELEGLVEQARTAMSGLSGRRSGNSEGVEDIEKLEGFIDRMCYEIKQLEAIVALNDRSSLFGRIEQLEDSIVSLRVESREKDEVIAALEGKFFDVGLLFEQRNGELQDAQKRIGSLTEENKTLKGRGRKMEEQISELERVQEDSKRELEELQQVKYEGDVIRKKLQAEKEGLLKEMGKMRDAVQKRKEEIKMIVAERDAAKKTLRAKVVDLGRNLRSASREKERLLSRINELERSEGQKRRKETVEQGEPKDRADESSDTSAELERLRAELEASKGSVNNANCEIIDLEARLDHLSSDKAKLEASIFHLESKKDVLVYQLGVEKATAEERLKELTKLMSDYSELLNERTNLRAEREELRMELTDLRVEMESLEKSVEDVNGENSRLADEIKEHKSERVALGEETRKLKAIEGELTGRLEVALAELGLAEGKIRLLERENSRLGDDFDALTGKNSGLEERAQVLLTEKNELATRINELGGENVALKDQLNKVKAEREYSSVELNKLQIECDKARSEGASLQARLEVADRCAEALQRANEELRMKVVEAHSEYRILENRLRISEARSAALKREKETLAHEYVSNLRAVVLRAEKEGSETVDDSIFDDLDLDAATRKLESEARRGKSDRSRTKSPKDARKKLLVENEALKFELLSLRSQNLEMKTELARARDELQMRVWKSSESNRNETAIRPVSNKLEIMNLCYERIDAYSGCYKDDNVAALACFNRSSICFAVPAEQEGMEIDQLLEIVNKLKIENIALKMELNTLRCNFVVNFTEDEKRRNQLRDALEEIRALKAELTKLRDEKDSLHVRLSTADTKLDHLESERAALKEELCTFRKTNSDLRQNVNELRWDYQKLREKSAGFENCIRRAIKQMKNYTMSTGKMDTIDEELVVLLKKYFSEDELLHSTTEKETNLLGSFVDFATL